MTKEVTPSRSENEIALAKASNVTSESRRPPGAEAHHDKAELRSRAGGLGRQETSRPAELPNEAIEHTRALARNEASRLRELAVRTEPTVTQTLAEVANANNGALQGLEHRLKTEESLTRKIETSRRYLPSSSSSQEDVIARRAGAVKDALRYTAVAPASGYTAMREGCNADLQARGYQRIGSKNYWAEPGSTTAGPYRGINEYWQTPGGYVFELQFHTADSFAHKMNTHELYEEMRAPDTPPRRLSELSRLQTEMADKIPVPDGVLERADGAAPRASKLGSPGTETGD